MSYPSRKNRQELPNPIEAIKQAKSLLDFLFVGPVFVKIGFNSEKEVEVVLMYNGFAIDSIHFDPVSLVPLPKGHRAVFFDIEIDKKRIKEKMEQLLPQCQVLEAVEFRDPEEAWAIPLVWNHYIIAHVKIHYRTLEIAQDYRLTQEVRKFVI